MGRAAIVHGRARWDDKLVSQYSLEMCERFAGTCWMDSATNLHGRSGRDENKRMSRRVELEEEGKFASFVEEREEVCCLLLVSMLGFVTVLICSFR